jgi:hypothetical protein
MTNQRGLGELTFDSRVDSSIKANEKVLRTSYSEIHIHNMKEIEEEIMNEVS